MGDTHTHTAPLPGRWRVWRRVLLRSAGFPADLASGLRLPAIAAAADAIEDEAGAAADRREAYEVAFAEAEIAASEAIRRIAADPLVREAVLWQTGPGPSAGVLDQLAEAPGRRNRRTRKKERLVAKYAIRYSLKNDTIGFFGPHAFADHADGGAALALQHGPGLVRRARVHWENWAIQRVADVLSGNGALRPWMKPRRMPLVVLEGTTARTPFAPPAELGAAAAAVLARADGERTARQLAAEVVALAVPGAATEAEVMAILERHEQRGWIAWRFEVSGASLDPAGDLRAQCAAVSTPARDWLESRLDRLEDARRAAERARGSAGATRDALADLWRSFAEVSGGPPTRQAGAMYAARTPVYLAAERDVRARLGEPLRRAVGPALDLVLQSARWYTYRVGRAYHAAFLERFDDLSREGEPVDFLRFHAAVTPLFPFLGLRGAAWVVAPLVAEVRGELHRRWRDLLGHADDDVAVRRRSTDLAPAVAEAFAAPCPGWPSARHHSPDLLVAASGPEAARAGAFSTVLGEVHAGMNTLENLFLATAAGADIERALGADLPRGRVSPAIPRERSHLAVLVRRDPAGWELVFDASRPSRPPNAAVPAAELRVVRDADGLWVETGDGRFRRHALEVYDLLLAVQACGDFSVAGGGATTPRITVDDVVISRRRWRFARSELAWLDLRPERERFAAARRWMRAHGLPERCYFKADVERKPFFIDFASPTAVEIAAGMLRGAGDVTLSEALPGPGELWLADRAGRTYTSELRWVVVDDEPFRPEAVTTWSGAR